METWPRSLKLVVEVVRASRAPMALYWGPDHVLFHNDAWNGVPAASEQLASVLATGTPVETRDRALSPVFDDDGGIGGVLEVVLTSRRVAEAERRLKESEEKFRSAFQTAPIILAVSSLADGRFVEVNDTFERVTGYARDEVIGRSSLELGLYPDPAERQLLVTALRAEGVAENLELGLRARNGELKSVLVNARLIQVGGRAFILSCWIDVTDRVLANQRLEEAVARKDDYLAMLGHELRNPLAAIRSATEIVKLTQTDDARLRRTAAVLERQTSQMARLVDGLLEVSRIARGKIDLQIRTIDLRDVIERVVDDRDTVLKERGLDVVRSLGVQPVWVHGDRVRLTQVVDNLLGNAVKFTDPPGTVTVTVHEELDEAVVRVRDTGVGVRAEMLSVIFEPFLQESQPIARPDGGLGLGLALAKGLVELHLGSIEARSEGLGKGTEIEVRLPLAGEPPARFTTTLVPVAAARRVLVVEDNQDAAQALRDLLQLSGHEVTTVGDGEQALEVVRTAPFDVVLCDLGLPGMSGYDVARVIRADEALRRLPLVAVTGYGQPEDRQRTAEAGFDDHLVKPVDLETLEQTLSRHE